MAPRRPPVVDIHTHMYPPSYIKKLNSRSQIPLARTFPQSPIPRLILLEAELPALEAALKDVDAKPPGRPITSDFASVSQKIRFMDKHHIDISVISLANPWLDFIPAEEAASAARLVNREFADMCAEFPDRLYFFAALPLTAQVVEILEVIEYICDLKYCKGVILGTSGLGKGLDDPCMFPIFEALGARQLPIFLHPHYGLPNEVWGPQAAEYGHVLPLALGFPMETTIAVTRMFLAGVFDRVPDMQVILAHSGGTLPFLAGRIESCVRHDGQLVKEGKVGPLRRTIWEVLKRQIYLDAVVYSEIGLKAAVEATGADRLLFGTDHPFFPPVESSDQDEWESASSNVAAVKDALGKDTPEAMLIMGANAMAFLQLNQNWT